MLITNAELAILSLLTEQPRHGYAIEQVIEERGMRDWTDVGFSSIYYVLKKLEGNGWVERRVESSQTRGPARTVYHVTPAGFAAWHAATYESLSVPQPVHSPFLLGLSNLPSLSPAEVRQALTTYRERLMERRNHVYSRWDREREHAPYFVQAMFEWSVTLLEAEIQWLDRFICQYIQKEESSMTQHTPEEKTLYTARKVPEIIEIPEGRFLTFVGRGAPESEVFQQAIGALYAVAYGLKFNLKAGGKDFRVPALEGLWWVDDPPAWLTTPREQWNWKLLIRMPDVVTDDLFSRVRQQAIAKKKAPEIGQVEFETFAEGLVAQVLHVGPFSAEPETIQRLHAFIQESGYKPRGLHHELYLSDFRRTAPEKLKTILRQPVAKA